MQKEKPFLAGQAVIEGVMIKNKDRISVAVRKENGKIQIKNEKLKLKESNTPFIRGIKNLIIMLYIGYKSLNYSTNINLKKEEKLGTSAFLLSLLIAIILAIGIFKILPLLVAQFISFKTSTTDFSFALIDGITKIIIFIIYLVIIGSFADVKRVFQYHGAEHKVVNCYENNLKLTLKNAKKFSVIHKRCGTNFVFLVLFLSILVYVFIPHSFSFGWKLVVRLLLLPIIASLAYEVLRFNAKHPNILCAVLISPGLLIQRLTTKEPDNKQLEVALKAILAAKNY